MHLVDIILDGQKCYLESIRGTEKFDILFQQYETERHAIIEPFCKCVAFRMFPLRYVESNYWIVTTSVLTVTAIHLFSLFVTFILMQLVTCIISGFPCGVNEALSLLGCFAMFIGSYLPNYQPVSAAEHPRRANTSTGYMFCYVLHDIIRLLHEAKVELCCITRIWLTVSVHPLCVLTYNINPVIWNCLGPTVKIKLVGSAQK